VGVDLARDSLDDALAEGGHDPATSTCWVWEGVTPYLDARATDATLRVLAARSAPGSTLLVTYATPAMIALPSALRPLGHLAFRVLGEPLAGLEEPAAFAARLRTAGFHPSADTGSPEWAHRWGRGRRPTIVIHERLVDARISRPRRRRGS
jgi:O-methyltransferase involved in polyketide biosynthesis